MVSCESVIHANHSRCARLCLRKMKATAALRGVSLKEFLLTAIEHEMDTNQVRKEYRVKLPLIRSKHPGTRNLTNAEIEDLLTSTLPFGSPSPPIDKCLSWLSIIWQLRPQSSGTEHRLRSDVFVTQVEITVG